MTAVPRQVSCSWMLPFLVWGQEKWAVFVTTHTPPFLPPLLHVLVKLHMPSHITHTHTHTSRKFHIHSWHCCLQKSCCHSNKSLLLQVPYLWAPSHKLCSSQSERTEQRTEPVINHNFWSSRLSVSGVTCSHQCYHTTITWLSYDHVCVCMYVCMYV